MRQLLLILIVLAIGHLPMRAQLRYFAYTDIIQTLLLNPNFGYERFYKRNDKRWYSYNIGVSFRIAASQNPKWFFAESKGNKQLGMINTAKPKDSIAAFIYNGPSFHVGRAEFRKLKTPGRYTGFRLQYLAKYNWYRNNKILFSDDGNIPQYHLDKTHYKIQSEQLFSNSCGLSWVLRTQREARAIELMIGVSVYANYSRKNVTYEYFYQNYKAHPPAVIIEKNDDYIIKSLQVYATPFICLRIGKCND